MSSTIGGAIRPLFAAGQRIFAGKTQSLLHGKTRSLTRTGHQPPQETTQSHPVRGISSGRLAAMVALFGAFSTLPHASYAQGLVNGNFENRSPAPASAGNCTTGNAVANFAPSPWSKQSTPDYQTQAQIGFHTDYHTLSSLGFDPSPQGGCFIGFRSLSGSTNEGIYQTITVPDASQTLQWNYFYAERTQPGRTRCTPRVEFRVNSNDDSNGSSISVAPTVGAAGGPSAEGKWVSLSTAAFTPKDYGITDGGSMDVYVGVIANGCRNTWGYVDALEIVLATDANLKTEKTLTSASATPNEGDTVTYEITVTNDGPLDATGVSLTDTLPAGLTATTNNGTVSAGTSYNTASGLWTIGNLANGDSVTLTLEGKVDVGQAGNTITNTTTAATGDQPDPSTDGDDLTESVTVANNPAITGVMSAAITDDTGAPGLSSGDTLTYSIEVTNTGNVTLTGVDIQSDTLSQVGGSAIAGFDASDFTTTDSTTLAPGESATFTAPYVLLQDDIDAGGLSNTATVVGTPPSGAANNVTDVTDNGDPTTDGDDAGTDPTDDPLQTLVSEAPEITGVMSAAITDDTGAPGLSSGDTLTYSIEVTNTGNVTLTGVDIQSDTLSQVGGSAIAGFDASDFTTTDSTTLAPGESATFTAPYVLLQDDIDAGGLSNTATVVGTPPSGAANNVTDVTDNGDPTTDGDDAGTDPTDDPLQTLVSKTPLLTATKSQVATDLSLAGDSATWNVGDQITYSVRVLNDGNVSISDVSLTDTLLPSAVSLTGTNTTNSTGSGVPGVNTGDDVLQPGEAWSYSYVYAVTQDDIDEGEVLNTATVSGLDPQSAPVTDAADGDGDPAADSPRDGDSDPGNDPNVVALARDGALSVQKTVDDSAVTDGVDEGDTLIYTVTVQNIGNVTLSGITLTDLFTDADGNALALDSFRDAGGAPVPMTPNPDGSVSYAVGSTLDVGDVWTFTGQFDLTASVIDSGGADNMVTVTATTPGGDRIEAESKVSGNTSRDGDGTPTATGFPGAVQGQAMSYLAGQDGIRVTLIDEVTTDIVATTVTSGGGHYEFTNIPPGVYTIEFDNPDPSGSEPKALSPEFEEDANRITGVVVEAGRVEVQQNAFLIDPSGVVYDSDTLAPVAGATVTLLFNGSPVPDAWLDGTIGDLNNTVTGSDGAYAFFLDPAAASDGVYSLQVSQANFQFASTAIPAAGGAYTPGLGGGVEQISANAVPTTGMATTYYLSFNFQFDPTSPAATSNGIINNHIPLDRNLGPTVEDDLKQILEDDLATTMTQLSRQMEGYSSGALQRLRSRDHLACLAQVNDVLDAQNILFDTDKATIRAESDPVLDTLAEVLTTCTGGTFQVSGHTDSRGSDSYNLALSAARADAVIAALAARGVVTDGFVSRGFGESQPIADNGTVAGRAQNRRVEFDHTDRTEQDVYACKDSDVANRSMDVSINESGLRFSRDTRREKYDCGSDSWAIIEGTASYFESDNGMSQAIFNLSYRQERFTTIDRVSGYFIGVYGSQNDISGLATGDIRGGGFNGGLYGATRLQSGLYADYYVGAAVGRHNFDLDFVRTGGDVNADGNYTYVAGFVGAALSGKTEFDTFTMTPRVGIDLAYSPGGDVDYTSSKNAVSQNSDLRLSSVNGGRVFGELGFEIPTNDDAGSVLIAPRIACNRSIGSLDSSCSVGGYVDLAVSSSANGFFYSLRFDGERGSNYKTGSLSASFQKNIWGGRLTGDATMTETGDLGFVQQFRIDF